MSPLRKIIIAFILIISIVILWALLVQRAAIQRIPGNAYDVERQYRPSEGVLPSAFKEGFTYTDADTALSRTQLNELKAVTTPSASANIRSYPMGELGDLRICDFCIKSSFNTACTGNYVSLDMITYVLSRGCRFLDFGVYYLETTKGDFISNVSRARNPCVAFTDDPTGISMKSRNILSLSSVFKRISEAAFQNPSPNPADPLFIQLRIYSGEQEAYDEIASLIHSAFSRRQYNGEITPQTLFSSIIGNVVIVLDVNTVKTPVLQRSKLAPCVNLYSGGKHMLKYSARRLQDMLIQPVRIGTGTEKWSNITQLTAVEPGSSTVGTGSTPNSNSVGTGVFSYIWSWMGPRIPDLELNVPGLVHDYGTQFIEYPFYVIGDQQARYEQFFADPGLAMVPMYIAVNYVNK